MFAIELHFSFPGRSKARRSDRVRTMLLKNSPCSDNFNLFRRIYEWIIRAAVTIEQLFSAFIYAARIMNNNYFPVVAHRKRMPADPAKQSSSLTESTTFREKKKGYILTILGSDADTIHID